MWRATLAGSPQKTVFLQVVKRDSGRLDATMFGLDPRFDAMNVDSIKLKDSKLKIMVDGLEAAYEGQFDAQGAITGTWSQKDAQDQDVKFERVKGKIVLDHSPHKVRFINVGPNVKLEILDWGGSGRPLVLLTGLGDDAHIYDRFATKLRDNYHVYGITRRGFGASSEPATGYSADELGDDVITVIAALKLDRPVLAGHSIGGEELSSIANHHKEKVAGLIYLDAVYWYAFYDGSHPDAGMDSILLEKQFERLRDPQTTLEEQKAVMQGLLQDGLPRFTKALEDRQKTFDAKQMLPTDWLTPPSRAILTNLRIYSEVPSPALAICAGKEAQAHCDAFQKGVPSARVVPLSDGTHYIFATNEADVLREINQFIAGLK